jgi:hypothetical protein
MANFETRYLRAVFNPTAFFGGNVGFQLQNPTPELRFSESKFSLRG